MRISAAGCSKSVWFRMQVNCCIVGRDNNNVDEVDLIMFNSISNPIEKVIKINVDVICWKEMGPSN